MQNQNSNNRSPLDVFVISPHEPVDIPFPCPECGGKLWAEIESWEEETGIVSESGFHLFCTDDEFESIELMNGNRDERDMSHRWWQSDWQATYNKTEGWLKAYVCIKK